MKCARSFRFTPLPCVKTVRYVRFGFAPPYLGRFLNGRIEGYVAARPLQPEEMGQRSPVDFVSLIAREMARLHRLPVTKVGSQREAEVWSTLPRWLALAMGEVVPGWIWILKRRCLSDSQNVSEDLLLLLLLLLMLTPLVTHHGVGRCKIRRRGESRGSLEAEA